MWWPLDWTLMTNPLLGKLHIKIVSGNASVVRWDAILSEEIGKYSILRQRPVSFLVVKQPWVTICSSCSVTEEKSHNLGTPYTTSYHDMMDQSSEGLCPTCIGDSVCWRHHSQRNLLNHWTAPDGENDGLSEVSATRRVPHCWMRPEQKLQLCIRSNFWSFSFIWDRTCFLEFHKKFCG